MNRRDWEEPLRSNKITFRRGKARKEGQSIKTATVRGQTEGIHLASELPLIKLNSCNQLFAGRC